MEADSPQQKTAKILSYIIAAILVLLPFHAVFTTWLGSNFNHLDLIRIWKEMILALITPYVLWLGWKNPKLKQWLKTSWVVKLFGFYILLHLTLGAWALHAGEVNKTA